MFDDAQKNAINAVKAIELMINELNMLRDEWASIVRVCILSSPTPSLELIDALECFASARANGVSDIVKKRLEAFKAEFGA